MPGWPAGRTKQKATVHYSSETSPLSRNPLSFFSLTLSLSVPPPLSLIHTLCVLSLALSLGSVVFSFACALLSLSLSLYLDLSISISRADNEAERVPERFNPTDMIYSFQRVEGFMCALRAWADRHSASQHLKRGVPPGGERVGERMRIRF